tara:strand:+ start:738 stop:965 length:228 start_codon:yes stop_codon:yes gene_type:complete
MKHILVTDSELQILLEAVNEAQLAREASMEEWQKENVTRFDNEIHFLQVDYNRTQQVIQSLEKRSLSFHFSDKKS